MKVCTEFPILQNRNRKNTEAMREKLRVDREYTRPCGEYTSVSGKMMRSNEKRRETMRNIEKRRETKRNDEKQ